MALYQHLSRLLMGHPDNNTVNFLSYFLKVDKNLPQSKDNIKQILFSCKICVYVFSTHAHTDVRDTEIWNKMMNSSWIILSTDF